ncbi:hypothetical protein [Candidatus Similichlamydia epinepheli]|uniref:hypothetical protein n=1 Tax=Candidatus Similichlamydia epinepheli TaxID=1903953 RepID=UPI000D359A68|nr:hypothetical protein [Candidatus Similichlamydia epinepheli]
MLGSVASACSWLSGSGTVSGFFRNNVSAVRCVSSLCDAAGGIVSSVAFQALGISVSSAVSVVTVSSAAVECAIRCARTFVEHGSDLDTALSWVEFVAFFITTVLLFMIAQTIPGWLGFCIGLYALTRLITRLLESWCPDIMKSPFLDSSYVNDLRQSRGDFVSMASGALICGAVWAVLCPSSFSYYTKPLQAVLELHFFLKEVKLL